MPTLRQNSFFNGGDACCRPKGRHGRRARIGRCEGCSLDRYANLAEDILKRFHRNPRYLEAMLGGFPRVRLRASRRFPSRRMHCRDSLHPFDAISAVAGPGGIFETVESRSRSALTIARTHAAAPDLYCSLHRVTLASGVTATSWQAVSPATCARVSGDHCWAVPGSCCSRSP